MTEQKLCEMSIEGGFLILKSSVTEIKIIEGQLISDTLNFKIKLDIAGATVLRNKIDEFIS